MSLRGGALPVDGGRTRFEGREITTKIANRGYVIVHGKIEFEGRSTREFRENKLVKKYYLADDSGPEIEQLAACRTAGRSCRQPVDRNEAKAT